MPELALHILDLVQNSISAGATLIRIAVCYDEALDRLTITIADDGCGMAEEFLSRVASPFSTTRTTRKVGLGIPLFKQLAELTGGRFTIESRVGEGTTLTATFVLSNVDLPPMGDLTGTVQSLLLAAPEKPDFLLEYSKNGKSFAFDTREVRVALGGLPLNLPDVLGWVGEFLTENILEVQQ